MSKPPRLLPVALAACCLSAATSAQASGPSKGRLQCYYTTKDVSPINGEVGYQTSFADALNLGRLRRGIGAYHLGLRYGPGHFRYRRGQLLFRGGALDDNGRFWHVAGTFHSRGVLLPHSTLPNRKRKFTVVLRDLRADDSDQAPAHKQFDMTRAGRSFWYCGR